MSVLAQEPALYVQLVWKLHFPCCHNKWFLNVFKGTLRRNLPSLVGDGQPLRIRHVSISAHRP